MKAECISNTDFQGRVVITNKLSNKPRQSVGKCHREIADMVRDNNYILYLSQDYSTNTINFELKKAYYSRFSNKERIVNTGIVNKINIDSRVSKYIETAKKTLADYKVQQEKILEQEQQKEKIKDIGTLLASLAYLPVFMLVGGVVEGSRELGKDLKTMINKAKKIAIKKG